MGGIGGACLHSHRGGVRQAGRCHWVAAGADLPGCVRVDLPAVHQMPERVQPGVGQQSNRKKSLVVCCVNCGSNMVIECEGPHKEEVDVSLGIPACEALDL